MSHPYQTKISTVSLQVMTFIFGICTGIGVWANFFMGPEPSLPEKYLTAPPKKNSSSNLTKQHAISELKLLTL